MFSWSVIQLGLRTEDGRLGAVGPHELIDEKCDIVTKKVRDFLLNYINMME